MKSTFWKNGVCQKCAVNTRLASEAEPYCIDCYKWMVIPVPVDLTPNVVDRRRRYRARKVYILRRGGPKDDGNLVLENAVRAWEDQ